MMNQGLIEEHNEVGLSRAESEMGFYVNSAHFSPSVDGHQSDDLKPFNHNHNIFAQALLSSNKLFRDEDYDHVSSSSLNFPPLFSLQRPSPNYNLWGYGLGGEGMKEFQIEGESKIRNRSCYNNKNGIENNHYHYSSWLGGRGVSVSVSAMKMKKIKARRKVREPRFCFKTMSDVDVLDDGYKWRKYGQKVVKNTLHPRSYYRCTQDNCRVKKRVERLAEDPRMVITTYEGRHIHSPSNDLDDSQTCQPHLNNFFW
ncbi:putative WRKY transcription factor 13 [Bienertia sinuspersici]